MTPPHARWVTALLGALAALGPLSMDTYLPGLPDIADDLATDAATVQLTVTACLVGLTVGQLVAGPLSDVWGRRRPLLAGLGLHALAGALCAVAPDATSLVVFRALHGVAGAFTTVIAFACIRDRETGAAAARTFSSVMFLLGVARVVAPLAGALLLGLAGWRAVFVGLAALSALVLVWCAVGLAETLPRERRSRRFRPRYLDLLRDPSLVRYTLVNGFVFGALFAYLTGSPFVLRDLYGLSAQQYGVVFAVNATGLAAAVYAGGRLARRHQVRTLLGVGVAGGVLGGLALLVVVLCGFGLAALLVAQFVVVTSMGLVQPTAPALALDGHGAQVASAAAVFGFGQFVLGGLGASLAGVGGTTSGLPMAAAIAGFALVAAVTFVAVPSPSSSPNRKVRHVH